jgi:hypothetical protein
MTAAPRRGIRKLVTVVALAMGLLGPLPRARAEGAAQVVAVLATHESRLADEIKRELESSKFEVLSAEIGGRRWQDAAREVDGGHLLRGVVVEQNDRTITVYTRQPASSSVETRLVLSVDPADRMARRHAALSVVEFLHALGQGTQAPLADSDGAIGAVRGGTLSRSGTLEPTRTHSPASGAPTSPLLPLVAPGAPPRPGWQIGTGTSFDIETNSGGPTSHLQFLGLVPFSAHVAVCARVLWPLLAAQTRFAGSDVRAWTFLVAGSLQYNFRPGGRLRPFLGIGVGTRLGLTETTAVSSTQSGQTLTTSATLGVEAGVRYSLGPVLQVFFELGAARAWLIPPVNMLNYERAAANGESARASVGLMFES